VSARVPSPYEQAGREKKANALVRVIDLVAADVGIDPIRDPLRVVDRIKVHGDDPAWWAMVAKAAEVKPPTDATLAGLTVRAVIGIYLERAASNRRRAS
jgi:hypothetical protein